MKESLGRQYFQHFDMTMNNRIIGERPQYVVVNVVGHVLGFKYPEEKKVYTLYTGSTSVFF